MLKQTSYFGGVVNPIIKKIYVNRIEYYDAYKLEPDVIFISDSFFYEGLVSDCKTAQLYDLINHKLFDMRVCIIRTNQFKFAIYSSEVLNYIISHIKFDPRNGFPSNVYLDRLIIAPSFSYVTAPTQPVSITSEIVEMMVYRDAINAYILKGA